MYFIQLYVDILFALDILFGQLNVFLAFQFSSMIHYAIMYLYGRIFQ
jgi:hypothetical protein